MLDRKRALGLVDLHVLNKAFLFFFFSDLFNKCKGDLIEVRDGTLKTQPNLLENLVFFVEVFLIYIYIYFFNFFLLENDSCGAL